MTSSALGSVQNSDSGESIAAHGEDKTNYLVFAIFLSAIVYSFALTGGDFSRLLAVQAAFVIWLFAAAAYQGATAKYYVGNAIALLSLGLVLSANLIVNHASYDSSGNSYQFSVAHVLGILSIAFGAQWACSNISPLRVFRATAFLLLPLIVLAIAMSLSISGIARAAPFGIHPNWWGEVAFGFILCSIALRKQLLVVIFLAFGLTLMILVESRGALLGAIALILVRVATLFRPFGAASIKKVLVVAVILVLLVFVIVGTESWTTIETKVTVDVFLVDDPYRGLDSNMAGRLDGWREAAVIFYANPIFGIGLDQLGGVHNGFMRWAGEGGITLLGTMLALIGFALHRSWRYRNDWAFASLLGILTYMMTYPRALNLNIVGIVFFFTLFRWRRHSSLRRD